MNTIIIYGKNPIRAALEAHKLKKLFCSTRLSNDGMVALARRQNLSICLVSDSDLTRMSGTQSHQGFVAEVDEYSTVSVEEMIASAKKKDPLIIILDGIEDPHNLGAILRSADAFGADGIILKSKGEVQLNGTVAKVSTGAINYVKVAVVPNLSNAVEKLKKAGYWIVASDGSAKQNYLDIDYSGPMALIVGSEGFGISQLLLKRSDFIVKIPMYGHVNSLNASVATAIFLAGISHARGQKWPEK